MSQKTKATNQQPKAMNKRPYAKRQNKSHNYKQPKSLPKSKAQPHLPHSNRSVLASNVSDIQSRFNLANMMGNQFEGNRNLYNEFGYPTSLDFKNYLAIYQRMSIAKRAIDSISNAIWSTPPEFESASITFKNQLDFILKEQKVYHYLSRADILARIGRFSVLLLGFSDGLPLDTPCQGTNLTLTFLRPYSEGSCTIKKFEENTLNPRLGLPLVYEITLSNDKTILVHYSRILHIAENLFENDVYGTPTLKPIYNCFMDLEKVVGGSAESFYQNANPGKVLTLDSDSIFDPSEKDDVSEQLQDFDMKFTKWLRLKGQEVTTLSTTQASPTPTFNCLISLIAGTLAIPKRILIGSERAHLASSMDETNWLDKVDERRIIYVSPFILRPFIERLQAVGVLPAAEFEIIWQPLETDIEAKETEEGQTIDDINTKDKEKEE